MNARLKPLLILAGSLCVCLLALVAYACILQFHGWYHGAPEEGIARYADVRQEDVRICVTQQEGGYLYAIWENAATGETSMTFLERQNALAAAISVPWVQRPSAPTALYSRSIKPVRVTASPKRASSSLPAITAAAPWTAVS